jgi:hypothetical protein
MYVSGSGSLGGNDVSWTVEGISRCVAWLSGIESTKTSLRLSRLKPFKMEEKLVYREADRKFGPVSRLCEALNSCMDGRSYRFVSKLFSKSVSWPGRLGLKI